MVTNQSLPYYGTNSGKEQDGHWGSRSGHKYQVKYFLTRIASQSVQHSSKSLRSFLFTVPGMCVLGVSTFRT